MDCGLWKSPSFVTMIPHFFYKHTHHHSWELSNFSISAIACFRLRAATLCSMICCDWQTLVLTCAHTTFLLRYPGNTGVYYSICFAFLSVQYQDCGNLLETSFSCKTPSCLSFSVINGEIMWTQNILEKSGNLGCHELGLTVHCV